MFIIANSEYRLIFSMKIDFGKGRASSYFGFWEDFDYLSNMSGWSFRELGSAI